jgi:hypothetical protein
MLQQHQTLVANGNLNGSSNGNSNGKKPSLALSASIYLTGGDKNGNNDWLGELPQCITANLKQVRVLVYYNLQREHISYDQLCMQLLVACIRSIQH